MQPPDNRRRKRPKKKIALEVDLSAEVAGFSTARVPTEAHQRIVGHYASPLLLGPPRSGDLLELVMHLFSAEEADLVQHLPPLRPRTARSVAASAGRSEAEVRQVLDHLAYTKAVILASGRPPVRLYALLPVVPGTFELALLTPDLSTRHAWHKRFVEIFERIYETGYLADYIRSNRPSLRALPADALAPGLNRAWPAARLEQLLEPFDHFAIGNCQCRMAMQLQGEGCDRPLENCVAFGPMAKWVTRRGLMREASRQAVIDAKRHAEQSGCVTWIGNIRRDQLGNVSCSCCGCCCHALRAINEFNAPGMICEPHFLPVRDLALCRSCKLCSEACQVGAWTWTKTDGKQREVTFHPARCIGCGLCVVACEFGALRLEPARKVWPQDLNWTTLVLKGTPRFLTSSFKVWARRLLG